MHFINLLAIDRALIIIRYTKHLNYSGKIKSTIVEQLSIEAKEKKMKTYSYQIDNAREIKNIMFNGGLQGQMLH